MEPMSGARGAADRSSGNRKESDMTMGSSGKNGGTGGKGYGRVKATDTKHSPGTAAGESSLSGAVGELHKQHPHPYTDHGPFYSHTSQPDGDK